MPKRDVIDESLLAEIHRGLSQNPKRIPAKYLYGKESSKIYAKACLQNSDTYYIPEFEISILQHSPYLRTLIPENHPFSLIELGPGDGEKIKCILRQIKQPKLCTYIPIDLSLFFLERIHSSFLEEFPDLNIELVNDDFITGLHTISKRFHEKKSIFLGLP